MRKNLSQLRKGERAVIKDVATDKVPLKLLEMGCLPGNDVSILQHAPFQDPIYINVNGCHLAIRKETAIHILIE